MGKRELHLCDVRGCDEKYHETCPFCGTECCRRHYDGGSPLGIRIGTRHAVLTEKEMRTCAACVLLIQQAPTRVFTHLVEPLAPLIKEALLAYMAERALAKKGSDGNS